VRYPNPEARNGIIRGRLPYVVEEWSYDGDTDLSEWRAIGAFQNLDDCYMFLCEVECVASRIRYQNTTLDFWIDPNVEMGPIHVPPDLAKDVDRELARIFQNPKYPDGVVPAIPPRDNV